MEQITETNKMTLGDRMKAYEKAFDTEIIDSPYVIIRLDGKAFHTYTKGLKKPFDAQLCDAMRLTLLSLCDCGDIQNLKFGYTQSDEISLFLRHDETDGQPWVRNRIQKMASLSAALATYYFNLHRSNQGDTRRALFDARVFSVPRIQEVGNHMIWRHRDALRNSVSMAAQAYFSHKKLMGVNVAQMKLMLENIGVVWEDYPGKYKGGTICKKIKTMIDVSQNPKAVENGVTEVERMVFKLFDAPDFSKPQIFDELIGVYA